jgi:Insertion element 4 transposase N-terminal
VTFCHRVVSVPAVVLRDGTVLADGWLPDFVRLGELERHVGDGVIEEIAAAAVAEGRVPAPRRRRLMSVPLAMRLTVAMTLMPEAGYAEAAGRLAGHLADVPWAQEWHVPASKVVTGWRDKTGPAPLEDLFWRAPGR